MSEPTSLADGAHVTSAADADTASQRAARYWVLRSLWRSRTGTAGAIIIALVLFVTAFGPSIAPHDPTERNLRTRFAPPGHTDANGTFLLGTDQLGRDILSRIIAGTRISVMIGVFSVIIAGVVGVAYGLTAGFFGGWVDDVLMRFADAFLAIPFIVLVVAAAGVLGPSLLTLILILGLTRWVTYARITRGETLAVREREYVTAARALGQSDSMIMIRTSERLGVDPRARHAHDRDGGAGRVGALVPRPRRPASGHHVGPHSGRWPPVHRQRVVDDHLSRYRHHDHRPGRRLHRRLAP